MSTEPNTKMLNYSRAVNAALRRALNEWPEMFIMGEDVAGPGGIFGVTRQLEEEFPKRVLDTPISESFILGGAVGASMCGMRPVVEIMWMDFALVALDQLVNQAANVRYVSQSRLQAPLTVRTQQGALPGSCAQHSQSLEAVIAHVPGLRVCLPATPQDAHDLLLASIASNDPCVVIEARALYFEEPEPVDLAAPVQPIGGAVTRRSGRDCTIVTWGTMVSESLVAAEQCHQDGIEVEVIDLRWLSPLDIDAVFASVAQTRHLVVAHEANVTGGFGAEIVAQVATELGTDLSGVARVGAKDSRIPASPALQAGVLPSADDIAKAVRRLADIRAPA